MQATRWLMMMMIHFTFSIEEANISGLYPGVTGIIQATDKPNKRDSQYALGCYPDSVHGQLFLFSEFKLLCSLSIDREVLTRYVTWAADEHGRVVYTTSRDIPAGEECCIFNFDLFTYVDFQARQKRTEKLFYFTCTCERCLKVGKNA